MEFSKKIFILIIFWTVSVFIINYCFAKEAKMTVFVPTDFNLCKFKMKTEAAKKYQAEHCK